MTEATRRDFLTTILATGVGLQLGEAGAQELKPTPACHDGDEPTVRQTEGPFFKPRSPGRTDLRDAGMRGRACRLSGRVLTRTCKPVPGALIDLWHADDKGEYDNAGFRLRGHVFADAEGRYAFRTIVPGAYEGRTRHFHVKIQAPNRPVLTTQFYFPGEMKNTRDGLFRRELLMRTASADDGLDAQFDVVLDMR